jgi:hypothetical protein
MLSLQKPKQENVFMKKGRINNDYFNNKTMIMIMIILSLSLFLLLIVRAALCISIFVYIYITYYYFLFIFFVPHQWETIKIIITKNHHFPSLSSSFLIFNF